jgi:hypothetical protein
MPLLLLLLLQLLLQLLLLLLQHPACHERILSEGGTFFNAA